MVNLDGALMSYAVKYLLNLGAKENGENTNAWCLPHPEDQVPCG